MKVVYNATYGGFGLSKEAVELFLTRIDVPKDEIIKDSRSIKISKETYNNLNQDAKKYFTNGYSENDDGYYFEEYMIPRHHPVLVSVVQDLGSKKSSGNYADLRIYNTKGEKNQKTLIG